MGEITLVQADLKFKSLVVAPNSELYGLTEDGKVYQAVHTVASKEPVGWKAVPMTIWDPSK